MAVVFRGSFNTKIATQATRVFCEITNLNEIRATFKSQAQEYTFTMKKWKIPKNFDRLAWLMLERFGVMTEQFGSVKMVGSAKTIRVDHTQTLNILKYVCVDVFECAEEIIRSHRHSLIDYSLYHCERAMVNTYEQEIHLAACHCLIDSKYIPPGTKFPEVEFFSTEQLLKTKLYYGTYESS